MIFDFILKIYMSPGSKLVLEPSEKKYREQLINHQACYTSRAKKTSGIEEFNTKRVRIEAIGH